MITANELSQIEKLVKDRGKDKARDVRAEMQSEGILGKLGKLSKHYGGTDQPVAKQKSAARSRKPRTVGPR